MNETSRQARINAIQQEFLAAADMLPDLSRVPDEGLEALLAAMVSADKRQKDLLEAAADHSLRLVPRLLRPVVRKIMFGGG